MLRLDRFWIVVRPKIPVVPIIAIRCCCEEALFVVSFDVLLVLVSMALLPPPLLLLLLVVVLLLLVVNDSPPFVLISNKILKRKMFIFIFISRKRLSASAVDKKLGVVYHTSIILLSAT